VRSQVGAATREPAAITIVGAFGLLAVGVVSGHASVALALLLAITTVVAVSHRSVLRWDRLIALALVVVLFVPIGRYQLPASLPFDLELYRVVVAVVLLLWFTSLLIDSSVTVRRTPFDQPLLLILVCLLGSAITNPGRVSDYGSQVLKSTTFFLSFVLIYYMIASVLRRRDGVDFLLKLLTLGGALIGALAVWEQRTYYNVFDHVQSVLPFLTPVYGFAGFEGSLSFGGNIRSLGPSQHPIALGAAMILILPFSIYFARTVGRRWWLAAALLVLGALSTGSRTAIVMLMVEAVVFFLLRPAEVRKVIPVLVPAIVVIHFALPGTIGSFKDAFFPKGGLIAQQSMLASDSDPLLAGGRIRQLKPMLAEASRRPVFGQGFGTRITGFNTPHRNAPILDNQWLGTVLEVGFVGLAAWVWLFVSAGRRLVGAARAATGLADEWLLAALAASVTSFAVGMLTFDAFGFTQVNFIFWIVLGISAALLRISGAWQAPPVASTSVTGRL
jgi:hypothetical protein